MHVESTIIKVTRTICVVRSAAFDEAVKHWPDQKLTLRQGIMLIREHPDLGATFGY